MEMMHRPEDRDLTFYLQVYRDRREARWCLNNLRRHYPQANVLIVSDGDDDPAWPKLAQRYRARYVAGQRLYATEYGGRLIQRMLDLFLEQPTNYLIKIDTDTWTHRRLNHVPTGCKVFGTLEWSTWANQEPLDYPNIQGGFVGYTLEAVRRISESKVLVSTRLGDYHATYADVEEIRRRAERGMVSFDFLTRYACRSLGIECVDFDEVKSKYRGWVRETQGQFAFTHPHKEIASRNPLSSAIRNHLPDPVRVQINHALASAKTLAESTLGNASVSVNAVRPSAPAGSQTAGSGAG